MSAGSGAVHARMSQATTLTRPAQRASDASRPCRVMIALGFFSTAYTRTRAPTASAASRLADTRGPRPAPTTMSTVSGGAAPAASAAARRAARAPVTASR